MTPHGAMDPKDLAPELVSLVRVSAALGGGDRSVLRDELEVARDLAAPGKVEEALVQGYLFVGFPRSLEAMGLWRQVSGREAGPPTADDPLTRGARGEATCRRVYGAQYLSLRANIAALHPDLDRWMIEEGYGKVLGRPGLDLPDRELCILSLLAGLGAPVQLYSHMRGALQVGVPGAVVSRVLEAIAPVVPARRMELALREWDRLAGQDADRTSDQTSFKE
jgi:4-carboxymuconolactone decarboxylase